MAKLAKTLQILRDEHLNRKWPQRPRVNDGWIGDAAHQARNSDHNANRRGTVDATDTDTDQVGPTPIHVPTVIASMIMHPSTHYIIHKGRIMDADDLFLPHVYNGTNHHDHHIHDSIHQTAKAESSIVVYKFILKPMKWPILKAGSEGTHVRELQAYLNGWGYGLRVDGNLGNSTDAVIRHFQKRQKITADGIVGPATRNKLRPFN